MDLGRIDNQTKPVNKLVTAKPSANRSALDCELYGLQNSHQMSNDTKTKFQSHQNTISNDHIKLELDLDTNYLQLELDQSNLYNLKFAESFGLRFALDRI